MVRGAQDRNASCLHAEEQFTQRGRPDALDSWHSRSPQHGSIENGLSLNQHNQPRPPTSYLSTATMLTTSATRPICPRCRLNQQQIRHASLIKRPKRPYTFTQLIILSDGSTFTHRTTSPAPIYRASKDTKNSPLWNPSSQKLLNVEEDEAGRLKRFRQRFGRGFDVEALSEGEQVSWTGSWTFCCVRMEADD